MAFLSVLKKDLCILSRCLLKTHSATETSLKTVGSFSKSKILFRTITDDTKLSVPKPKVTNKVFARFKLRDKISNDNALIYRVEKSYSFQFAHVMVIATAVTIPISFCILAKKSNFQFPVKLGRIILLNSLTQVSILLLFTAYIVICTFLLVGRFPLRIYRNKITNEYTAIYSNMLIPWKTTQLKFKKGDVRPINEEQQWFFQLSNYMIKGSKVIFIEEHFELPMELENMMG